MKEDVTRDPVDVGLFGSQAVMLHAQHFPDLSEELRHEWDFNTKSGFTP
jgi:hypothetical protein